MLVVHSNIRVSAYTDKVVVVSPQEGEDLLAEFPPRLRAGWPAILAEVHTRGMLDISLFTPSRDASGNPIVARAAWKYANLEPMLTGEGGMTSAFAMHDSGKFAITVFPDIKAIMAAAPAHVSKSAQAEAMQFQSHAGSIEASVKSSSYSLPTLCFNPTLVRLRLGVRAFLVAEEHKRFNPTLVRLRPANLPRKGNRNIDVSIPRWFD